MKEFGEVEEALDGAVLGLEEDLVEVGWFVEGADGGEGFGVCGVEGECAGEVDFGEAEAGVGEGVEGGVGGVVFEGEVAGVVVDADAVEEGGGVWGFVGEAVEEGEGFGGVFEVAEGFGFEAEVEVVAGLC